jgi:hypothetical protein
MTRNSVVPLTNVKSSSLLYVLIAFVLFAGAGIYGHIKVSADPSHITGISLVLDHIFNILVAGGMFALFFAVGRKLLSLFNFEWRSFAEEFAFSIIIGAATLAFAILAVALAGLLNRYAVGIIFLAALILCGRQLRRLLEVAQALITRDYSKPIEVAYILGFLLVVLVMVLRALTPPHAYDEAIYHLAAVKRFLEAGSITPLYDLIQGNLHLLWHMLYAPCLMVGADSATKLLSVGFALVTALALYGYASRFLTQTTGYVAALAFFGAGMVTQVGTTARIDVTLAGVLFLATYAMTVYLEDRIVKWLWLSGLLSGIAVSIKLTGLLWVAILGAVYLIQTGYKSSFRDFAGHLRLGVFYFLLVLAVVSPWLVKNYVYFHNPIYPLVSGETVTDQRSQAISRFGPAEEQRLETYFQQTRERNVSLVERIRNILATAAGRRVERHPFQFWGYFTDPNLFNVGEPNHTPNYLFLVCPLFLLFARDRRLIWLALSCVVFFIGMSWSAWTARYLLPIYPPLTLIGAYVVVQATEWLKNKGAIAVAIPVIALLITTGSTLLVESLQMIKGREFNYINGSMSRADFMNQFFYYPSLRYVNDSTGPDVKVFMMGCQMGYDLQRAYVADTGWESTPWRRLLLKGGSPQGVRDTMKGEGITHVIYSPDLYPFATSTGNLSIAAPSAAANGRPDYYEQWRNWATFEDFKTQYLQLIYTDKFGYTVFTLR